MVSVSLSKEVFISADNKIGLLRDLSKILAAGAINIRAISGYIIEAKAFIRLIVSDYSKAEELLRDSDYNVVLKEVVLIEAEDKIGALEEISERVEQAGIDLKYIYGSASSNTSKAILIVSSSNNEALLNLFS